MCTDDDAHPQYDRDMNNVGLPSPSQYSPEVLSQQFRYVVSVPVWILIQSFPVLCGKVSNCTEIDIHYTVSLGELFLTFWWLMVSVSLRVSSLEDEGSLILRTLATVHPVTQGEIPEDLNPLLHHCENPKPHNICFLQSTKFFITFVLLVCDIHDSECGVIMCRKYRCLMCLYNFPHKPCNCNVSWTLMCLANTAHLCTSRTDITSHQ